MHFIKEVFDKLFMAGDECRLANLTLQNRDVPPRIFSGDAKLDLLS